MLMYIAVSTLISTFIILLLSKVGFIEYLQIYAPLLLSKLANCNFCLSFWVNLFVCIILLIIFKDNTIFIIPFLAAPLTRYLL